MERDVNSPADAHTAALSSEVVDLLHLLTTSPTRQVVTALRWEAPVTLATVSRTVGLPADTVENCLGMLIDRNVVRRSGVPPRYRYTDAGAALWPVIDALDDLCDCCEGSDSLTSE